MPNWDVLVLGAGLVGASLALAIRQQLPQMRLALIDPQDAPAAPGDLGFDRRVVALNGASEDWLRQLGVWPGSTRPSPYSRMAVWDGEGTAEIVFTAEEAGVSRLGHIQENGQLQQQLWQQLKALDVPWFTQRSTGLIRNAQGWQLSLADGQSLDAHWVLAADGAQSPARAWAGLPVRRWPYGQTALVATVKTQQPHGGCAYQRFSRHGPLAFLPLADASGRLSSIVWSLDDAQAEAKLALDDQAFAQALGDALEWRLGAIEALDARLALPLHQCHATRYQQQGFAVLGDAAHAIHPLAGQGVNLGLADAAALVEELARACGRRVPLGHSEPLARYERRRMAENLAAMAAMESFKRLFGQRHLAWVALRNWGLGRVAESTVLKARLARLASGRP